MANAGRGLDGARNRGEVDVQPHQDNTEQRSLVNASSCRIALERGERGCQE